MTRRSMKRRDIVNMMAAAIEREKKPPLTFAMRQGMNIKKIEDHLCLCVCCGLILDKLTLVHAQNHGYPDKASLVKDGKLISLMNRRQG